MYFNYVLFALIESYYTNISFIQFCLLKVYIIAELIYNNSLNVGTSVLLVIGLLLDLYFLFVGFFL